jgi:hypothetical protein
MRNVRKLLFPVVLCCLATAMAVAQSVVDAGEIVQKIDRKQPVQLSNAVIRGTLDLTELSNQKQTKNSKWGNEEYKSRVEAPLVFRNCTFEGDVIAYKVLDENGKARTIWNGEKQIVYTADFKERVVFENCTFKGKSEFKYSEFAEEAVFTNSKFQRDANFKYADFREDARFAGSDFGRDANFKYANFHSGANFTDIRVDSRADFKYTDFREGVSFTKTRFGGDADFKYTDFGNRGDFTNADFGERPDFKYAKGRRSM